MRFSSRLVGNADSERLVQPGGSIPILSLTAPWPVGTCRVGSLVGPGTVAIAAGIAKTFNLGETVRMKFESTFTNLPNHLNYAPPATDVTSPSTLGKLTSVQNAENAGNRTGQVALRIEF